MENNSFTFGLSLWQIILSAVLISLPVLYLGSNAFKYYFKLTVYYTIATLSAVCVTIYSIPRPRNTKNHLMVKWTCRYLLQTILGLEVVPRGLEHWWKDTAGIVCINHQSSIDLIPLFSNWPDKAVCLAKRELFYAGPFGLASWLCGTVWIDRSNSVKARQTMDYTVSEIKQKKLKVIVFPEGTRNHKGGMLPFKKGAFHIAVQAQVPIIPLVLSSYEEFYSKPGKRFDEGKILMEVLPPIPTEGLTADDVGDLTEKTREKMLECFQRISKEAKGAKVVSSS